MSKRIRLSGLIWLLALPVFCLAEKGRRRPEADSILAFRDFAKIVRGWQKPPVQVGVRMVRGTTVQAMRSDTATIDGEFWLSDSVSYAKMGAIEQVVSRNRAVVVNHDERRIMVFEDAQTVSRMMSLSAAGLLQDTSLQRLSKQYRIERSLQGDTVQLRLSSRNQIERLGLPEQELIVKAAGSSLQPYYTISIRRHDIPLDPASVERLEQSGKADPGSLVKTPDGHTVWVKEDRLRVEYQYIRHEAGIPPKASVDGFVTRDTGGRYTATGSCQGYMVSKESF